MSGIMKQDDENFIRTMNLNITGNVMIWQEFLVQISNISYITTENMQKVSFPWVTIPAIAVGCMLFKINVLIALIVLACSIWIMFKWFKTNQERSNSIILTLCMNSGEKLSLIFTDKGFLTKVMHVLEKIITNGGIGKNNTISIDMSGCQFKGDATLLNNLGVK